MSVRGTSADGWDSYGSFVRCVRFFGSGSTSQGDAGPVSYVVHDSHFVESAGVVDHVVVFVAVVVVVVAGTAVVDIVKVES